jgi:putative endonuclease
VYILKSESKGLLYKGFSKDPEKRLLDHNSGKNKSTKGHRPWKLVYIEKYPTRMEAREREKYFKSGIGREYLRKKLDL